MRSQDDGEDSKLNALSTHPRPKALFTSAVCTCATRGQSWANRKWFFDEFRGTAPVHVQLSTLKVSFSLFFFSRVHATLPVTVGLSVGISVNLAGFSYTFLCS